MTGRSNQVEGLAQTLDMFGVIPEAARDQLAVELGIIGYEVLRAQKRDVAKDTGELEAGLALKLYLDELRVRIGLLGLRARSRSAQRRAQKQGRTAPRSYGGLFYGVIVEKGRKAQVVNVIRGSGGSKARSARRRSEQGLPARKPYKMRVKALAPRPYVHKDRPELRAEQRLAAFWGEVLGKTGAGA